jgi:hypothetical protein
MTKMKKYGEFMESPCEKSSKTVDLWRKNPKNRCFSPKNQFVSNCAHPSSNCQDCLFRASQRVDSIYAYPMSEPIILVDLCARKCC